MSRRWKCQHVPVSEQTRSLTTAQIRLLQLLENKAQINQLSAHSGFTPAGYCISRFKTMVTTVADNPALINS